MKVKTTITKKTSEGEEEVLKSSEEIQPQAIESFVEETSATESESEVIPEDPAMDEILADAETPEGAVMDSVETHEDGSITLTKGDEVLEIPADAVVIPNVETDSTIPPDLIVEKMPEAESLPQEPEDKAPSEELTASEKEPEVLPSKEPEFNEAAYPDVQQAVVQGQFKSGLDHYNRYGKAEGR